MDELSIELTKIDNKIQKYNDKKYLLLQKHPKFQINNPDNEIQEKSEIIYHYEGYENDIKEFINHL